MQQVGISHDSIVVGLTEKHGIAREAAANPPDGVSFVEAQSIGTWSDHIIKSPAKGVLRKFEGNECDLLEAPLFPILTTKPWVYTPARMSGATAFNLLGAPLPRSIRIAFIKKLLLAPNFLQLVFKSQAGLKTLESYANISDSRILEKTSVVYPAIRRIEQSSNFTEGKRIRFLFSGDFFSKGGASVVDAFNDLCESYPEIHLTICSPSGLRVGNQAIEKKYQQLIENNNQITFGAVTRIEMMEKILPNTDVFVTPTFWEAFGFANLEASAHGIPVISTNHFAINEVVPHGLSGFLIETDQFDYITKGSPGMVKDIPTAFHDYMTQQVHGYMKELIDNEVLRKSMGEAGRKLAREKFSFETRNKDMLHIYQDGLERYRKPR